MNENEYKERIAKLENPLEKEFMTACDEAMEQIDAKMEVAVKAIREALQISEKFGVPFRARASLVRNSYTPRSFEEKFGKIDFEELEEHFDYDVYDHAPNEYGEGWEHSSTIC